MKLAIMQPYFFPYIGYFQAISAVDKYILYDELNFIKDGWVNRNRILINGKPTYITVHLQHKSSYKKISEITVSERTNWRKKIIKSIYFNYKKSKYFKEFYPLVEKIVLTKKKYLSDLNKIGIIEICKFLDINTEIITDSKKYSKIEKKLNVESEDLINMYNEYQLTKYEPKVIRILEFCKYEKSNTFVNAIGGKKLYNKEEFRKNGIKLLFVKTKSIKYKQSSSKFYSNLSIIDLIMNCGKEKTKKMIKKYELI